MTSLSYDFGSEKLGGMGDLSDGKHTRGLKISEWSKTLWDKEQMLSFLNNYTNKEY